MPSCGPSGSSKTRTPSRKIVTFVYNSQKYCPTLLASAGRAVNSGCQKLPDTVTNSRQKPCRADGTGMALQKRRAAGSIGRGLSRVHRRRTRSNIAGQYRRPISPANIAGQYRRPISPANIAGQYRRPISPANIAGQYRRPISPANIAGQYRRPISPANIAGQYRRKEPGSSDTGAATSARTRGT